MDQSDWRCAVSEAGVEPEDTDPAALVENEQAVWRLGRGVRIAGRGAWMLSSAHTEGDVEVTRNEMRRAA